MPPLRQLHPLLRIFDSPLYLIGLFVPQSPCYPSTQKGEKTLSQALLHLGFYEMPLNKCGKELEEKAMLLLILTLSQVP